DPLTLSRHDSRRRATLASAERDVRRGMPMGKDGAVSARSAMSLAEYASYDATGLAALVRRGEGPPAELLETAIEAVEALNPQLNAVVIRCYDMARRAIAEGLPDGPFRGVPFLLKDLTAHCAGTVTSCGWIPRADTVVDYDTELVARYK